MEKKFLKELLDHYADHYARVNMNIVPGKMTKRQKREMDVNYGYLIGKLKGGSKVLDLGCGTGLFLAWLQNYDNIIKIGVDISESQVKLAKEYLKDVEIICDDCSKYLSDKDEEFDAIFCIDLLEHLSGLDEVFNLLKLCYKALIPGGFIYCRVPNAANLTASYSRYLDLTHERIFTSKSLLQMLVVSGYKNCEIIRIRSSHFTGKARLVIEHIMHKIIYRICGRGLENVFTSNICIIGYKII